MGVFHFIKISNLLWFSQIKFAACLEDEDPGSAVGFQVEISFVRNRLDIENKGTDRVELCVL